VANASGPHHIRSFARWLMRDLQAVRNAITEHWSNAQTEGQINKLKTLKRSMYGRAGVDLLRARSFQSKAYRCTKIAEEPVNSSVSS